MDTQKDSEGLLVVIHDGLEVDHAQSAPEYYKHRPQRSSGTNSLEGAFDDTGEKEHEMTPCAQNDPRKQTICGIHRRWFWVAVIIAIVTIVAAVTGGIIAGIDKNQGNKLEQGDLGTPGAPEGLLLLIISSNPDR